MKPKLSSLAEPTLAEMADMNPCEIIDQFENKLAWVGIQIGLLTQTLSTAKEVLDLIRSKLNCPTQEKT